MKIDTPSQIDRAKNSERYSFSRIGMEVLFLLFIYVFCAILFKAKNVSVLDAIYDFPQSWICHLVIILTVLLYDEFRGYRQSDIEWVSKLDSPLTNDALSALKVLKRRRIDISAFLPKILPKLMDESLMERSVAYAMIKKYYPEAKTELIELENSNVISDISLCRNIVTPILENYNIEPSASLLFEGDITSLTDTSEELLKLRASFPHSSEVRVPEKPTGKSFQLFIQVCCMLMDLFILVLWLSGAILAFFVSGWLLKLACIVGCFALGYGLHWLSLSYHIRRFFLKKISYGNEHIKRCLIATEKLGTQDKFHLLADDMGYLFATSDGYKLVTLGGVNHLLEKNSVKFVRVSKVKTACAIDCQNLDTSSIFDMVLNPMHNWDLDTQTQGELKYDWFRNYMNIAN